MLLTLAMAAAAAATPASSPERQLAEQPLPTDLVQCDRALANINARRVAPILVTPAVRRDACLCVKASFDAKEVSEKAQQALAISVAKCINAVTAPVSPDSLSPHTLSSISVAFRSPAPLVQANGTKILDLSTCKLPEYPRAAARAEATGITRVAFLVYADGRAQDGEITRPSGYTPEHKLLDATALVHLRACRFNIDKPANGAPSTWVEIEYQWRLE